MELATGADAVSAGDLMAEAVLRLLRRHDAEHDERQARAWRAGSDEKGMT